MRNIPRVSLGIVCAGVLLGFCTTVHAQGYGLAERPVSSAYLNNHLPPAEASTTGWSFADAFPGLTFDDPTVIIAVPFSNRLLVATQKGFVHTFVDDPGTTTKSVFLDLSAVTQGTVGSGLMGIAFHPEYGIADSPNKNYIYVFYSYSPAPNYTPGVASDSVSSYNRLSRFTVSDDSLTAIRSSEVVLINQYDRHLWHAGGAILFDNEGYLYLSCGDEGGNNDPYNHGNKINNGFFCGVLRIDVDQNLTRSHPIRRQPLSGAAPPPGWPASYTQNYTIPNDNPWLDTGGAVLEEFYALGFRNPHRMTYDAQSNRIWLGDVGQSTREEVSIVEKGGNYQWGFMEGTATGAHPRPNPIIGVEKPPVFDYPHTNGYTCVIGGYVYRGTQFASFLAGKYIFGDNGTARIRAMTYDGTGPAQVTELTTIPHGGGEETGMSTFGIDTNNELLMCCAGNGVKIYKLTKANTGGDPPALLSQTGAFESNLTTLTPAAALIPYTVNSPLWSDNAVKSRWMTVPNDGAPFSAGETVTFANTGAWNFPIGTVFVKHFELPIDDTNPAVRKRLETRFLVRAADGSYYGLTYKWRADNSEADLLPAGLNEAVTITTATGTRTQTWSYPSRQDCIVCHNPNAGSVLGLRTCELNGDLTYPGGVEDNQIRTLNSIGLFSTPVSEAAIPTLPKSVSVKDTSATFETRVRSYIDANCAHCHRPGGVKANFDARFDTPLGSQGLIRGEVQDPLGLIGAKLIVPSDPAKSMLRHRDSLLGTNQMPPLARNMVDVEYINVLTQWINSIPPNFTLPGGVFISQVPVGTGDDGDYELGMKFRASQSGAITAIRYYRPSLETGTHTGRLWSAAGALLATVTFTGESSSGWQTATLDTPVQIDADTTYVVSANCNTHYPFTDQGLATSIINGPLSSVADGTNGVFNDLPGGFPAGTYHNSNYFRDVLFTPGAGTDPGGSVTPVNVFTNQTPTSFFSDNTDYELGMKFRTSRTGIVTSIRYYRPAQETGTHIGRLWTVGGTLLGTATFTNETASGWQSATLTTPVILAANTTYMVSVNTNSYYPFTAQGLAASISNSPLSTVADGANGVINDTAGVFPNRSFSNANYFRDVLFTPFSSFELWKMNAGLAYNASPTGDTDGDGMNLLLEFAFGSDPQIASDIGRPTIDGTTYTFHRARADLTYIVETSEDLSLWTPLVTNPGTVGYLVSVDPGNSTSPLFIRLRVTSP
ncbi:MAG: DUF4082 domain-containing protein [Chthoniobacteraceae bacterium]